MTKRKPLLSTKILIFVGIVVTLAHGQLAQKVQQKSESSTCSNIVALTGNVNINCSNLTPEQKKELDKIPGILKKILANQLPADEVMKKLDEMQKEMSRPTLAQECKPGAACAMSSGQQGGITAGQVFFDTHPHIVITDGQQAAISEAMKPFGGHSAMILLNGNNQEMADLGKHLNSAFVTAMITSNLSQGFAGSEDGSVLLPIQVQYGDQDKEMGESIIKALVDNHVLTGRQIGVHYYQGTPGHLSIILSAPTN